MGLFFDMLFPPRTDEIALRDISLDEFLSLLAPRLVSTTNPGTTALFPFSNLHVRSSIHEAKYHGSSYAFTLLAQALAEYLRDGDGTWHWDSHVCIVPIPLGEARRKERGFNQVEEVVARTIAMLDEEMPNTFTLTADLLIRIHETVSQVSLPREKRWENMRGAFGTTHTADPTCIYIIIDDVLTTGSTLQAAIDALQKAGATHICPIALAH